MASLLSLFEKASLGFAPSSPIRYCDRETGREETEKVYGDLLVRLLYSSLPGEFLADKILSRRWVSMAMGAFQSSSYSRKRIDSFIETFGIPMDEYEEGPFRSFNEFFVRKFKYGLRPFETAPSILPAFAEARYLGFESVQPGQVFPVKGENLSAEAMLGTLGSAPTFSGGPVLIARLCPVDYHRFHFPDGGTIRSDHRMHGKLHSVNPLALKAKSDIFSSNERHVSILETDHFGKLAYIEVGAMCVGRIVQTHPWSQRFERGAEKGYFLFGASTVILFGQPGKWVPDADILANTRNELETFVKLGKSVGRAK